MQLLLGYLVALAVFLGGGYAGVQWLLAPDEAPALAQNAHPESASARLINAKKIRDARALRRRQAESLAEGAEPPPVGKQPDAVVAHSENRSAKTADQPDSPAPAHSSPDTATPQLSAATVAANDAKLDARAEVNPVVAAEKIKAARNESQSQQRRGGKSGGDSAAAGKSAEAKAGPAPEPTADRTDVPANKKQAVWKKKRVERIASSSRKPVMMILRTIEFPDGRREQRLLPMAQAGSGLARYGNVSAFADDDDF